MAARDVSGQVVQIRINRYDAEYDSSLDAAMLDALVGQIEKFWKPKLDLGALIERDADLNWDWRGQVLTPAFTEVGTLEPRGGTLLVLESERDPHQPEAVARVIYDWKTRHLPRQTKQRGRPPVKPLAAYVDTLAVAPWNRAEAPPPARVRELGRLLLFGAILLSHENGHGGRIALHAAPLAESWYQAALPGAKFEYDRQEIGDLQDASGNHAPYVEVDDSVAWTYCTNTLASIQDARGIASVVNGNVVNTLARLGMNLQGLP
ncbi:hypothetical protein ABMY26_33495 [Azospirillum sp. HJ39]|uniref:hypothetical protein n=1 Tax=Azospirillum TaxID=191 RepID=UPI0013A6DA23|nr:hypothetical protein [Azospirillum ramasamyi]